MASRVRPQPLQLVRDLRVVVNRGVRVAPIARDLTRLPVLAQLLGIDRPGETPVDTAIRICDAIAAAIDALGDGPYGRAAANLFGTTAQSRGLALVRRRGFAAEQLDIQPATFVRHWQRRIIDDVAVELYKMGGPKVD